MTFKMEITKELEQELISELKVLFRNQKRYYLSNFQKLQGADTETFSFTLNLDNQALTLIFRVYRELSDRAEYEFRTLTSLFNANLPVPEPLLWNKVSPILSRSYLVMKKVPGVLLSDYYWQITSENERDKLLSDFIQVLVDIHKFNWRNNFHYLQIPDLESNPYILVDNLISFPRKMIIENKIIELSHLIGWLEKNKVMSEKLSLLHGDFHMNNIIVTPNGKIVVIDWANIKLGDFRHDLGFAIVAASSTGEDASKKFIELYKSFSGETIYDIEYFMILSALHNILRCYSALINPSITNETEFTKKMFLETYKPYTRYLVKITEKITGIYLRTLDNALTSD
ncbi:MAG: phosphotransferase [Candidatus Hodarchaeota archaeon]